MSDLRDSGWNGEQIYGNSPDDYEEEDFEEEREMTHEQSFSAWLDVTAEGIKKI